MFYVLDKIIRFIQIENPCFKIFVKETKHHMTALGRKTLGLFEEEVNVIELFK
jgi:hypothetical protein